jgi:hypothetical protein
MTESAHESATSFAPSLSLFLVSLGNRQKSAVRRTIFLLLFFSFPFTSGLGYVFIRTRINPITLSVFLAYLWLVFSPLIIRYAYRCLENFLIGIRSIMSPEDQSSYRHRSLSLFVSRKHLFASIPLGIIMSSCAYWYGIANKRPSLEIVWLVVMFGTLGVVSGVGFWGVGALSRIVNELSQYRLRIDFSHPDQFGGLRSVGTILVKGTTLFFTGSLLIPFAFDLLDISNMPHLELIADCTLIAYVLVGLVSFFVGILRLHRFVFEQKVRIDNESGMRLGALIEENLFREGRSVADVLRPWIYYQIYHSRISEMKEYPFEAKTLLELGGSIIIPVSVFIIDKLLR